MTTIRHFREQYIPGQTAQKSGLYRVHHGRNHRDDHDVVAICRDEFPGCRGCGGDVRYVLLQEVAYITHNFDLTGPAELIPRRTIKLA
jgi:hypothetical protein